jgi:hypothetical protein
MATAQPAVAWHQQRKRLTAITTPIFTVTNQHLAGKNQPPQIDDNTGTYRSYFESGAGDQAIFVFDRNIGKATLYLGDNDWVPDDVVHGMPQLGVWGSAEQLWLQACWEATH